MERYERGWRANSLILYDESNVWWYIFSISVYCHRVHAKDHKDVYPEAVQEIAENMY